MIWLNGREIAVEQIISVYRVNALGEGSVGVAWRLQLEDYGRIVALHHADGRWLRTRQNAQLHLASGRYRAAASCSHRPHHPESVPSWFGSVRSARSTACASAGQ
jgi:hypothetical protein